MSANNNLQILQAVAERNVGVSKVATLGRKALCASSLCVLLMANPTASFGTRREVFICLESCRIASGEATRNEDLPDL